MKTSAFSLVARMVLVLTIGSSRGLAQTDYTPYTFKTIAGVSGAGSEVNGTGSAARFNAPHGVAVDKAGNIYVGDYFGHTIRKITHQGANWVVTTLAGSAGNAGYINGSGTSARFNQPVGVCVDEATNVYVTDSGNRRIRKITPQGVVTTLAGSGTAVSQDGSATTAGFQAPNSLTVDRFGTVFVTDWGGETIRKVAPDGTTTTVAGLAGLAGTNDGPNAEARFFRPWGIAVDSQTNLYVTDTTNCTIRKITPSGTNWVVSTLSGKPGVRDNVDGPTGVALFDAPAGIAIDTAGNLYIANRNCHTIRKIWTNGIVTTLVGIPYTTGTKDGTGSFALLNQPRGVAVDAAGNLYAAEPFSNNIIRQGHPENAPVQIVSTGTGFGFKDGAFHFDLTDPAGSFAAVAGQLVVVETSADLVRWLPVSTNTFGQTFLPFSDAQNGAGTQRFYRARTP